MISWGNLANIKTSCANLKFQSGGKSFQRTSFIPCSPFRHCPLKYWRKHCRTRLASLSRVRFHLKSSLPTHPRRWTPTASRSLCRSSTHRCTQSQSTGLPRTPSQFKVPPCRLRHRSGWPLEWGSHLFHHQPRPNQNSGHSGPFAPCSCHLPHLQMDSSSHTRSNDSLCSQPPFRGPNQPSQSRWRAPIPQWPPCTTPPRPHRPQSTTPSLMDFTLDFAHLETGQYKNSPNAWKLTSKTAPWPETYRGKKAWGKKKKKSTPVPSLPNGLPPHADQNITFEESITCDLTLPVRKKLSTGHPNLLDQMLLTSLSSTFVEEQICGAMLFLCPGTAIFGTHFRHNGFYKFPHFLRRGMIPSLLVIEGGPAMTSPFTASQWRY